MRYAKHLKGLARQLFHQVPDGFPTSGAENIQRFCNHLVGKSVNQSDEDILFRAAQDAQVLAFASSVRKHPYGCGASRRFESTLQRVNSVCFS